jgi:hypothetical protein
VIIRSMESFSVENLQALIICAFDVVRCNLFLTKWFEISHKARLEVGAALRLGQS